jgi:hypothetical protein
LPPSLKSISYTISYWQYSGSLVFHLRLSSKWQFAGTKLLRAIVILWDITPCGKQNSIFCLLRSAHSSALKTEVIYPREHLLFHWNTRHYIWEDRTLQNVRISVHFLSLQVEWIVAAPYSRGLK